MDPEGSIVDGSPSPPPAPTDGSAVSSDPNIASSEHSELKSSTPSFLRLKRSGINGTVISSKRRLSDLFSVPVPLSVAAENNIFTSSSSSATVRALLANRTRLEGTRAVVGPIKQEIINDDDGNFGTRPLIIIPDNYENGGAQQNSVVRHQNSTVGVIGQDGALNFSLCALNGLLQSSVATPGGSNNMSTIFSTAPMLRNGLNDSVKDEQRTFYSGFEFLMNPGDYANTDMSGFNKTFVTFGGPAGGLQIGDGSISLAGVLQGGMQMSADQIGVNMSTRGGEFDNRGRAPSMFTISNCVRDGLAMHLTKKRTTGGPAKPRIRSRVGLAGRSMKVKDIIMYDDSAPLHAQRGSKIEGDFLLDSLNVEGKKRRRRTAEDTLTPEEIAEYMGSSSLALAGTGGSGLFRCRFCADVTSDLSRYFNHTLSAHAAYICHQCGKSFTTKSSLLRHRPIHTGMRRFACSICRKAFYRKDKCKAHIKRHLGTNPGDGASAAMGAAPTEHSMLQSPPPHVQVAAL